MFGYDYSRFQKALSELKEEAHLELLRDIAYVKARVEVVLDKFFNTTTFIAYSKYPGHEM